MPQTKIGNPLHFGMKAHIGVDAETGLVHGLAGTSANVHDITQAESLLHESDTDVFADTEYRGIERKLSIKANWQIAVRLLI